MKRLYLSLGVVAALLFSVGAAPRRNTIPVVPPFALRDLSDSMRAPWNEWVRDEQRRWLNFDAAVTNLHIRADSVPLIQHGYVKCLNSTPAYGDSVLVSLTQPYGDLNYRVFIQLTYDSAQGSWNLPQWVVPTSRDVGQFYIMTQYDDSGFVYWMTVGDKP